MPSTNCTVGSALDFLTMNGTSTCIKEAFYTMVSGAAFILLLLLVILVMSVAVCCLVRKARLVLMNGEPLIT